ncbi:hypothetical protein QIU19_11770 [Capnocytophaga canimorsus]|nr:hypothetical protein [Capnocytophaga canimorsus]WGU69565.1 hypothetical protein QIU19_11770 [Capnocytophaga canimorsus]
MYQLLNKIIIALIPVFPFAQQTDFLTAQKKYERVRIALKEKQEVLRQKLDKHNLSVNNLNLIFVAYKDDDLLEIYGKSKKRTYIPKNNFLSDMFAFGKAWTKKKTG